MCRYNNLYTRAALLSVPGCWWRRQQEVGEVAQILGNMSSVHCALRHHHQAVAYTELVLALDNTGMR